MTTESQTDVVQPDPLEVIAARLASVILYGHSKQELTDLLIEFAEEVKNQAIEP